MRTAHEVSQESENNALSLPLEALEPYLLTLMVVGGLTAVLYAIGRPVIGEGVIALAYLAPISWVSARWGRGPGILAAAASALAFDFLFIPPFFTLNVGSVEGWLLLGIFLGVAVLVVGRIQVGFEQARRREQEALLMYELSQELASAQTPEAIARTLGAKLQEYYLARQIQVVLQDGEAPVFAGVGSSASLKRRADLIVPVLDARNLVGEVRLWEGKIHLPAEPDRLLQNLANQSALALERARLRRGQHGAG